MTQRIIKSESKKSNQNLDFLFNVKQLGLETIQKTTSVGERVAIMNQNINTRSPGFMAELLLLLPFAKLAQGFTFEANEKRI